MHCKDSTVELEVSPEEPEVLIMTCKVGDGGNTVLEIIFLLHRICKAVNIGIVFLNKILQNYPGGGCDRLAEVPPTEALKGRKPEGLVLLLRTSRRDLPTRSASAIPNMCTAEV